MAKKPIILALLLVIIFCFSGTIYSAANLLKNSDFEELNNGKVSNWTENFWQKDNASTIISDEKVYKSGSKSILIQSSVDNDARIKQDIPVKSDKYYKLSCYIKTEGVGVDKKGANITVSDITDTSKDIKGNSDWQYVELYGLTGKDQKSISINLALGGYGSMNKGKAWFDDIVVEQTENIPKDIKLVNFFRNATPSNVATPKVIDSSTSDNLLKILFIYVLFLFSGIIVFYVFINNNTSLKSKSVTYYFSYILAFGLLLRLIIAPVLEGHPVDMNCFKAWASIAANNLTEFYNSGVFVDYPPLYIYILYLIAKISSFLGIMGQSSYIIAIKSPSIIADIVTSYLLYHISKEKLGLKLGALIAMLYLFNPITILNSTIWGQVDSLFTMLIIIAVWLLVKNNLAASTVVYVIAVLMKPQGIIFLPILFFHLLKSRNLMLIIKSFIYSVAAALAIILPFSISKEPLWIFKLYMNTASGYKGATINAFNLFALLGANWKDDTRTLFIFSYGTWGMIFIILTTLYVGYLYLKGKGESLPAITSTLIITGVFVLASKMHERYMYPALALALLAFIYTKDKRILWFYALSSFTGFLNTYKVFILSLKKVFWIPANDVELIIISTLNIGILIFLIITSYKILIKQEIIPIKDSNKAKLKTSPNRKK